jgi:hypothetical protein
VTDPVSGIKGTKVSVESGVGAEASGRIRFVAARQANVARSSGNVHKRNLIVERVNMAAGILYSG